MASNITIFHLIGYWYLAISLVIAAGALTHITIEWLGKTIWKKMTRLRDVYVLNWWIHAINSTGKTIPTKANVDLLFEQIKRLEEEDKKNDDMD